MTEFLPHIFLQIGIAGTKTFYGFFQRIDPNTVYQVIFPGIAAGGNGQMVFINKSCFDPG